MLRPDLVLLRGPSKLEECGLVALLGDAMFLVVGMSVARFGQARFGLQAPTLTLNLTLTLTDGAHAWRNSLIARFSIGGTWSSARQQWRISWQMRVRVWGEG